MTPTAFTDMRRLPEHVPQRERQSREHRASSYVTEGRGEGEKRAPESLLCVTGYCRFK